MSEHEKLNILMVDDSPDKLLTYEVILSELGEHLIKVLSQILLRRSCRDSYPCL